MLHKLSIGQLGKTVGLSPKTIRFYEEIHVISIPQRRENGYRYYETTAVEELQIIKHARDLGLPISEIKKLMIGCQGKSCSHTQQYVSSKIVTYLQQLEAKIQELRTLKNGLQSLQKNLLISDEFCKEGKYCCNILHQLIELKKGGSAYAE